MMTPPFHLDTALGPLLITRAGEGEFAHVHGIKCAALAWVQSLGITQWTAPPDTPESQAWLREKLACEEIYLVWHQQQPVTTVRLEWADPMIWGERGTDGLAGYLHGFFQHPKAAGHGIGSALLAWAAQTIADRGKTYARLDCMAENVKLCRYYRRQGFTEAGLACWPNWRAQLYEKRLRS